MNKKVQRLLSSMAVVLKDEDPKLIAELDSVINDEKDGYPFDFIRECEKYRILVKG